MKPNSKERSLVSSGMDVSGSFGISKEHAAHIMTILRNTMYTDKILAVLREYSANAWDAHRMVGKMDVPIKVTLPSELEPTLSIRDFGPGISPDDIFKVYTQYGASTKRDNDVAVGMLGIGSKSGFAYSDSFTVSSYFAGKKTTYVAVLDKTNVGVMTALDEQPCGTETGVEIQVPVKPADIEAFIDRAKTLFRYFIPLPDINTEIGNEHLIERQFSKVSILKNHSGWTAVMGCIPYRINVSQVDPEKIGQKAFDFIQQMSGLMYFDIGEVEISASREELNYTDETKKVLEKRFIDFIDEYAHSALKEVEASGLTQFERRLRLWSFSVLEFAIPEALKPLMVTDIEVKDSKTFSFHIIKTAWKSYNRIWQMSERVSKFSVGAKAVILLKDDRRLFRGFELSENMIVVKSLHKKKTITELMPELGELLKKMNLDGITIKKLSEIPFVQPPSVTRDQEINEKHKVTGFRFMKNWRGAQGSDAWEISRHEPDEKDVFVVLSKFNSEHYNFYSEFRHFRNVATMLNQPIPTIYGYKTTAKKPITDEDIKGTDFLDWTTEWFKGLATLPDNDPVLAENLKLVGIFETGFLLYGRTYGFHEASKDRIEVLRGGLGPTHPVVKLVEKFASAEAKLGTLDKDALKDLRSKVPAVNRIAKKSSEEFTSEVKSVLKEYPLFKAEQVFLQRLFTKEAKLWMEYIKAVDHLKGTKHDDAKATVHADGRVPDDRVGGAVQDGSQRPAELRGTQNGVGLGGLGQHPQVPDGVQSTG